MLHPDLFATLDILWSPHTIDRFSSYRTRQVPQCCSHFPNPDTEAIDAFSVAWSGENNWLFPPPYLVPKVLRHLEFSKVDGTLIVSHWESAPWWPLLIQQKNIFKKFIADVFTVTPRENVFFLAVPQNTLFGSEIQGFNVLVLRCCFCRGLQLAFHWTIHSRTQNNVRYLLWKYEWGIIHMIVMTACKVRTFWWRHSYFKKLCYCFPQVPKTCWTASRATETVKFGA